jgi:ABC-type branched-subunit amino acid transport system ATPase component
MNSNNPIIPAVSAQSVTKQFGDVRCLDCVSLDVRAGEKVAIVGGNGSGKTTLIDVLTGFAKPDSGGVYVNGVQGNGRHPAWFSRRGILRTFQSPRVFEQMTVAECLTLAGWVPDHPTIGSSFVHSRRYVQRRTFAEEQTQRALVAWGWKRYAGQQAGQLSYGQRKFLAVLQLTLADGSVAVCDEPTAGLDSTQAACVTQMLQRWQSEHEKRALLVATHDLEYASKVFDRTYRISDGTLLGA